MATSNDKFKKLARKWVGSIGAGGVADGTVTTIPLSSSSGLPTDTAVVATIDRVDANGIATPSLEESVVGVVSGDNLVTCTRGAEGTAQAHSAGAVVEILFTAKGWNDLIDALLVGHAQSGAHTSEVVNTLKASGSEVDTGTNDAKIVTPKAIADSKVLRSNEAWDGWLEAGEAWSYKSATEIYAAGNVTGKYQKGDKIKLTQTTIKYFNIIGISAYDSGNNRTTLTVTGGSDYSVANAAITDNYYSKAENPQGFPMCFSFTPVFSGAGGSAGSYATQYCNVKFAIRGNTCHLYGSIRISNKGSWSGTVKVSMPVAGISLLEGGFLNYCGGFLTTYSGNLGLRGYPFVESASNSALFTSSWDAASLDWSVVTNGDRLVFHGGGYLI